MMNDECCERLFLLLFLEDRFLGLHILSFIIFYF